MKKVSAREISPEIVSMGREPPGNGRRAAESAGTPSKVVVELGAKPLPDTQESNPGGGRGFSGKSDLRSRQCHVHEIRNRAGKIKTRLVLCSQFFLCFESARSP